MIIHSAIFSMKAKNGLIASISVYPILAEKVLMSKFRLDTLTWSPFVRGLALSLYVALKAKNIDLPLQLCHTKFHLGNDINSECSTISGV